MSEVNLSVLVSKPARDLASDLVSNPLAVLQSAIDSGDFAGEAKRGATAYANMTRAEEAIGATKTYVGAYVIRCLDQAHPDGKAPFADVSPILPISAGRVSQLRNAGRLMFDLSFAPTDTLTRYLTSKNPKGLGDALAAKDVTPEGVRDWASANVTEAKQRDAAGLPALEIAGTRDASTTNGTVATSAPAPATGTANHHEDTTLPRNASTTLDAIAKLVANLESFGPITPASATRLGELVERLAAIPVSSKGE